MRNRLRMAESCQSGAAGAIRLRLLPLLATLAAVALGISAGIWQTGRASYKEEIEVKLQQRASATPLQIAPSSAEIDAVEFRRLRIQGEFIASWPVFLDNRPYKGRAGFYLLMPFKLSDGSHLLVARGWLARDGRERNKLPAIQTPSGVIEIEGMLRRQPGRLMQLGQQAALKPNAILQNLTPAEFAQASGLRTQTYILEQLTPALETAASTDGLIRDWPRASSGADKHRAYAFQWFGLAGAAFVFYIITGFRRARSTP